MQRNVVVDGLTIDLEDTGGSGRRSCSVTALVLATRVRAPVHWDAAPAFDALLSELATERARAVR